MVLPGQLEPLALLVPQDRLALRELPDLRAPPDRKVLLARQDRPELTAQQARLALQELLEPLDLPVPREPREILDPQDLLDLPDRLVPQERAVPQDLRAVRQR